MATARKNLTFDEGALADAQDIADAQRISLSEYVSKALIEANLRATESAAPEWEQRIDAHLAKFDGLAAAAQAELAHQRATGKAGNAA
ncbi:hypothetical protein [Microtetraspora sp. NBRC 16547]|uniref:hypothetical protein n=1 Tax=Microtetraspora sp. NBRC 16547 TaxID=3030993 RepID=UPI00249F9A35|nr:hypothetical protein [Microtetraspora sp. NBRC 16547]GLX02324.1 hypothetical protein Misp02_64100 [Microtetraspora sp. NBRC 16547]